MESYEYDEELEEIKRRKLQEYQRALEAAQAEEQRRLEEERRQEYLRRILTPKARERLTNLRMVRPELVEQLEIQLIQLAQTGRIPLPVTDDLLKELLARITEQKKEIRIKYTRGSVGEL
ncbi:MAG: DNA-binding protein [Thermofilaceae archaeon]